MASEPAPPGSAERARRAEAASPPKPIAGGSEPSEGSEQYDAPPFLSWRAIYLIVIGALAVEIALGAVVTVLLR